MTNRNSPNILVAGTPGTGKSTLAEQVANDTGLRYINVGQYAKQNGYLEGFDEEYQCDILNEDALEDGLETELQEGGIIVDYHSADIIPDILDYIIVLRTNNTLLFDRLKARGYTGKKFDDNMECEIMQVILDEAREKFGMDRVIELQSDTTDDMEANIAKLKDMITNFKA
eukprot:Clim_evm7s191 gene=Clim_evmTU7s191